MAHYSLDEFVQATQQQDRGEGLFELENSRMFEVNLNGMIWIKTGSMVAYVGNIKFEREGILEKGVGKMLKKAVTGEGARLTKARGNGRMYLADTGKSVQILRLQGEAIYVNGSDLLAFEHTKRPRFRWAAAERRVVTRGACQTGGPCRGLRPGNLHATSQCTHDRDRRNRLVDLL